MQSNPNEIELDNLVGQKNSNKELFTTIDLFITKLRQQQQLTTEDLTAILSILKETSKKKNNNAKNLITTLLIEKLSTDECNQTYFKLLLSDIIEKKISSKFAAQFIEKNKSQPKEAFKSTFYIKAFITLLEKKSKFKRTDLLENIIKEELFIDTDILQFSLPADVKSLLEYAYIKKHFEVISLLSNNKTFTLSQQQAERLQQRYLQETATNYDEKLALSILAMYIKMILTRQTTEDWHDAILSSCENTLKLAPNTLARNLHKQLDKKEVTHCNNTRIEFSMNVNYQDSQKQSLIAKTISQEPLTNTHIKLIKKFIDSERLCLTEKDVTAIIKTLEKKNVATSKELCAYFKQNFDKITFTTGKAKGVLSISLQTNKQQHNNSPPAISNAFAQNSKLSQANATQNFHGTGQSNVGSPSFKPT